MANNKSKISSDHETVKRWAQERGGKPAKVKGTGGNGSVGMIRFTFSKTHHALEEISWDEFFKEFDKNGLALLYQEQTRDGKQSRFFKFISKQR